MERRKRRRRRTECDLCSAVYAQVSSHLSVTIYVEDINDHAPQFVDAPYHVTVDELTPVGEILDPAAIS